jgi:hypothetical protein
VPTWANSAHTPARASSTSETITSRIPRRRVGNARPSVGRAYNPGRGETTRLDPGWLSCLDDPGAEGGLEAVEVKGADKSTRSLQLGLLLCVGVVAAFCPGAGRAGASMAGRPIALLAALPGPVCAPGVRARTCTGPVRLGVSYPYTLPTHCGVLGAYFNGRLWRASPALTDGSHNPPPGWANPFQVGAMRLRSATRAEFRSAAGLRASFRPAPRGWRFEACE